MSNQVRALATNSISEYVEYFRQFKKKDSSYPLPEEVIQRQYGPDDPFEKTFLTLKLGIDKNEIVFEKSLSDVKKDLVGMVTKLAKSIDNIPRADN